MTIIKNKQQLKQLIYKQQLLKQQLEQQLKQQLEQQQATTIVSIPLGLVARTAL